MQAKNQDSQFGVIVNGEPLACMASRAGRGIHELTAQTHLQVWQL